MIHRVRKFCRGVIPGVLALAGWVSVAPGASAQVAPKVMVAAPQPAIVRATSSATFVVTYTGASAVTLSPSDVILTPSALASAGGPAAATVTVSGSGTTSRTINLSGFSGNGFLTLSLKAGTANNAGKAAAATSAAVKLAVDTAPPVVTIVPPKSTTVKGSSTADFGVVYGGASTVSLSDATKNKVFVTTISGNATANVAITGSGSAARTIRLSGFTGDGTIALSVGAGTASDLAGNQAAASVMSVPIIVDNSAPAVAISQPSVSHANAKSKVTYTVSYSGASKILLTPNQVKVARTGTVTSAVAVSGTGNTSRTITVSAFKGDGTVAISLPAGTAVDAASNVAPAVDSTGTTFNVDTGLPTIALSAPSATNASSSSSIEYLVTYGGVSTITLAPPNVTLAKSGTANASVAIQSTGEFTRKIVLSGFTGNGTIKVAVAAGTGSDQAINLTPAVASTATVTVDTAAPAISIGAPSLANAKANSNIVFNVRFTGATSVSLVASDIVLNKTGDANAVVTVTGSGAAARVISLGSFSGEGTIGIKLPAGVAVDAAGNQSVETPDSLTIAVDTVPPSVVIGAPSSIAVKTDSTLTFVVSVSGATSIKMTSENVVRKFTGTAWADKVTVTGTGSARTVTLSNFRGSGEIGIAVQAGIAVDSAGNPSVAPSDSAMSNVVTPLAYNLLTGAANLNITSLALTSPGANATAGPGSALNFTANTSFPVNVTGTPSFQIRIGNRLRNATYVAGSGTSSLSFRYIIAVGDNGVVRWDAGEISGGSISAVASSAAALNTSYQEVTTTVTGNGGYLGTVGTPTFNPAGGGFGPAQTVSLQTSTADAEIFYTTDGSAPTVMTPPSLKYNGSFSVEETTTVKAIGALDLYLNSDISVATYTINGPVSAPTFGVSPGTYPGTQTVSIDVETPGALIYYSTNGETPTAQSTLYTGPVAVSSTTTLKAIGIKSEYSDSDVLTGLFRILPPCGNSGNGCYDNLPAKAAGAALLPDGTTAIEYVEVNGPGTFKVWREQGGNRILNANGLWSSADDWQETLTRNGRMFTGADLSSTTVLAGIAGRACPTNVYAPDNMISTGNCVYYDGDVSNTRLDAFAGTTGEDRLNGYDVVQWYEGNIKPCADKGMRLPTLFETDAYPNNSLKANLPADVTPVFSGVGVPPKGSWSYTATSGTGWKYNFWYWWSGNGSSVTGFDSTGGVRCVLPPGSKIKTAPVATSIAIKSGDPFTNSSSVSLTLSAVNASSMYITNTAGCGSGGTWENYATTKAWTLGQTNGIARVYAKFRNESTVESACINDYIIHDSNAPASTSISLNAGANYTTGTVTSLSLAATGASQVYITNTAGCGSGGTWTSTSDTGYLYVAEYDTHRIRRISIATGAITTIAGTGTAGFSGDGGAATSAQIKEPYGLAFDSAGNLIFVDSGNYRIRKINSATGIITTIAGNGNNTTTGDGGAATSASMTYPRGVTVDASDNIYIGEYGAGRIRKIDATTGNISTVAGGGANGSSSENVAATAAPLGGVWDVAFDSLGNMFIADYSSKRVRRVDAATGLIKTFVGNGAALDGHQFESAVTPVGLDFDAYDNLFIGEYDYSNARKVFTASQKMYLYAGFTSRGFSGDGGAAAWSSRLDRVHDVAADLSGNLYIGDTWNSRIRKVNASDGIISTVASVGVVTGIALYPNRTRRDFKVEGIRDWTIGQTNATATVYAKFKDDAGNESACVSDTIIHDNIAPTAPTVTSGTVAPTTITWNSGGGGSGTYRYKVDNSDMLSGTTSTTTASLSTGSMSEGSHTVYIQESDAAGNWSTSAQTTIIVDRAAPLTPTLSQSSGTYAVAFNLTVTQNVTPDANFKEFRYNLSTTIPTCTTGTVYATPIAITASTSVRVIACDLAGQGSATPASATYTIGVDTTPPVITGGKVAGTAASLTNFADTGNGATLPGTTPNGAAVSTNYFGPNPYSTSMSTSGSWTAICSFFSNNSEVNTYNRSTKSSGCGTTWGNASSTTVQYVVVDLGQSRTFNRAIYYQMYSDGKTTHARLDYSTTLLNYYDAGWTQAHAEGALDDLDRSGYTTNLLSGTQGNLVSDFPYVTARYVRLGLRNTGAFSNSGYVELYHFKLFDTNGGQVVVSINGGGSGTLSPSVTDPESSITYLWTNQTPAAGTLTFATPTAMTTAISGPEGTYTVRLTATNSAGLSNYTEYTLKIDNTAPTITSGSVPAFGNTVNPTASLTLSEDATVTLYSAAGCSTSSIGSQALTAGARTMTASGSVNATGTTTIYAKAVDAASNGSTCVTLGNYTIDTTPPNAPTVTSTPATTANKRPTWTWTSGGGGGNGTYRYALNNYSNLWSGSATETSATSWAPTYDLSVGSNTLYVLERDAAGNWSTHGSFAISVVNGISISSISTSTATSSTLWPGTAMTIYVNFNGAAWVSGQPQLELDVGLTTPGLATYSSGNGSSSLAFSYTTGSTHSTNRLTTHPAATTLKKNSGSITDSSGIEANMTLPARVSSSSIWNANIIIQNNFMDVGTLDNGTTLWAALRDWSIQRSTDGGLTWTQMRASPGSISTPPRLFINPGNANHMFLFAENIWYSTYTYNRIHTTNAFTTSSYLTDSNGPWSWASAVAMAPSVTGATYVFGMYNRYSTDNLNWSVIQNPSNASNVWYPFPEALVHPTNKDIVMAGASASIARKNTSTGAETTFGNATFGFNPAGLEQFQENGQWVQRVIGERGELASTKNFGDSWSIDSTNTISTTNTTQRFLKSLSTDRSIIATAGWSQHSVNWTVNGGQTWTTVNTMTDGSASCYIRGLALTTTKIIVACNEYGWREYAYSGIRLANGASDRAISTADLTAGQALISDPLAANASASEYAVVTTAVACNAATSYGSAIPVASTTNMPADGNYVVCVRRTNLNGVIGTTYERSGIFKLQRAAPVFNSATLINAAADGIINITERIEGYSPIVGTVSATGAVDASSFVVVANATSCDSTLEYQASVTATLPVLKSAGTYKICVKLENSVGSTYATGPTITYDSTWFPVATLSGLPAAASSASSISVTVGGTGVETYRFKVVTVNSGSCSSSDGYSSATSTFNLITSGVSGTGGQILCVVGINSSGTQQPFSLATTYKWYRFSGDTVAPVTTSPDSMLRWLDVQVAPDNAAEIYAINSLGDIYRSLDSGATWSLRCRQASTPPMRAQILLPGNSKAFVLSGGLYEILLSGGDRCPIYTEIAPSMWNPSESFMFTPVSLYGSTFYAHAKNNSSSGAIFRSTDSGSNWTNIGAITGLTKDDNFRSITVVTNSPRRLLANVFNVENSYTAASGIYTSSDGGASWTQRTQWSMVWNKSSINIACDADSTGYCYSSNGYYSYDYGATWLTASGAYSFNSAKPYIKSGYGYRFRVSGSDTLLERATNMASPSWSTIWGFTGLLGDPARKVISISGNTMVVIIDGQMYRSTNSGSTFARVFQPQTQQIPIFAQSIASSGNTIVAADFQNILYKSSDAGTSWSNPFSSSLSSVYWHMPRVIMNEANSNLVYVYDDDPWGSNYSSYRISSTDGLATVTETDASPSVYSWMESFARSLTDSTFYHIGYGSYSKKSTNFGAVYTDITYNNNYRWVWYPWVDNFVNPLNSNLVWYGADTRLYEGNISGNTETDLSSRVSSITGNQAGMELYSPSAGSWTLRVIGATGKLAVSTNSASSFTAQGSTTTALTNCQTRQITSLASNRNVIVSSCIARGSSTYDGRIAFTRDGGSTWTERVIGGCSGIRGHAQTATKIYFACVGQNTNPYTSGPLLSIDY